MYLLGLHLPEQGIQILCLRDKMRLPQKSWNLPYWKLIPLGILRKDHGVLHVQNTDDVVDILLINRIAGILAFF